MAFLEQQQRPAGSMSTERWVGFVTAVWVQAISGNNYTFSNYSDALKSLMSLTQLQLNGLSVAKDIGKAFGLLAGIASDRLPTPAILLIGSLEGFAGYGVQWLVVGRRIRPLPYWQMCVFLAMGGNSTTWMNTAVLVTCMRNFPRNRGPVSGILKGYVGLSTAIFTDLCTSLFSDDPSAFVLVLAVVPLLVCFPAVIFLREVNVPPEEGREAKYFGVLNGVSISVALFLLAFEMTGPHGWAVSRVCAAVLILLLASPLSIPAHNSLSSSSNENESYIERQKLLPPQERQQKDEANPSPSIGEEHTIAEAIRTVDFWILFSSFLCGVGTGLAVMNNMGQIGLALGHRNVSVFVSLISVWGFFGRILSGSVSEHFIGKAATPRPVWNAASQVLMAAGYVLMAAAMPGSLYIGSTVVGICYGVRLAISVPTASEMFGLKHYGLVYNVLILNLPLGSFIFSGMLAGVLYDSHATEIEGGGNTCVGAHCYRLVFLVMAAACFLGFGLDALLAVRTKHLYSSIHEHKKSKKSPIQVP